MSELLCDACGAGTNSNHLTCQFCGATCVDLEPKQELEAIKEIAATARRIGGDSEHGLVAMMAQTGATEGQSKHERITTLWTHAFVPMTFEAQAQALAQVVSAMTTSGRADPPGKLVANEALVRRGELLCASMDAHAASDPSLHPRAVALRGLFEQTRHQSQKLEQTGKNKTYLAVGFSLAVLAFIVFGVGYMMDSSHPPQPAKTSDPASVTPTEATTPHKAKASLSAPDTGAQDTTLKTASAAVVSSPTLSVLKPTKIPRALRGEYVRESLRLKDGPCSELSQRAMLTSNSIAWSHDCASRTKELLTDVRVVEEGDRFTLVAGTLGGGSCAGSYVEKVGSNLILQLRCKSPTGLKAVWSRYFGTPTRLVFLPLP
jgi:hypothetical protein